MMLVRPLLRLGSSLPAPGCFRPFARPAPHSQCFCPSFSRLYQSSQTPAPAQKNSDTQQLIQERYAGKVEKKLKEKGFRNLEELRNANRDQAEADQLQLRKLYDELIQKAQKKNNPDGRATNNDSQNNQERKGSIALSSKKYSSPLKPLDSIINMSKFASESASEITKLWTAYHLSTSNPPRLGAVIPTETYKGMIQFARKYPSFIIPLAKSSSESSGKSELAFEMQYLQWDFVNQPPAPKLPDFLKPEPALTHSTLPATIVMYTPLAEYKLRQSFAQPTLILTHYTDLSDSHGIVLMRGDITPSSSGGHDGGKMTTTDAQLLVLRLQQFYYPCTSPLEDSSLSAKRKLFLRQFHEEPDQFNLSELLELVRDL